MVEYKIIEAKSAKQAEELVNELAKDGWKVVSTAFWMNFKAVLTITLEREKK